MRVGSFTSLPTADDLEGVRVTAEEVKETTARLLAKTGEIKLRQKMLTAPPDVDVNFLYYDSMPGSGQGLFRVCDGSGKVKAQFNRREFEDHVSEMRAEWTFAKFPYLTELGFPEGIVIVGPLSRTFRENGPLDDSELRDLSLVRHLRRRDVLDLESIDACRLLEIFWASRRILSLLGEIDLTQMGEPADLKGSGKGIGVVEAPRGVLVHSYLVKRGCLERMRLLVATQFNNPFMNLLLRDLAERHLDGDRLSQEGEHFIGRCIRVFDPCLSCATH
jgi:coenzyme F420-reducing hydrogenase alpha subunit